MSKPKVISALIRNWGAQTRGEYPPKGIYFKILNTGKDFYLRFRRRDPYGSLPALVAIFFNSESPYLSRCFFYIDLCRMRDRPNLY